MIWKFFSQYQHPSPRSGTIVSDKNVLSETVVNIFPNPATDEIVIQSESIQPISQGLIQLVTLAGNLILEQTMTTKETHLKVNEVASGMYLLRVLAPEGKIVYQEKLLIQ